MSSLSNITKSSSSVIIEENLEDSLQNKKERLKKEINELKVLSSNLKYGIGITKFGHDSNSKPLDECLKHLNLLENNVHDTKVNLQYVLHRYAGLHCAKFTENSFVFKFASFGENQKSGEYAVQILIDDGKGKLGKWVMPMWLNMEQILLETPIQYPENMSNFLKNCKHHIFCYHRRMTEFNNLKSLMSEMKNCSISANLDYTQINLDLFGIHEMESSTYLDLTLHLVYHSCQIQPYLIVTDSLGKRKFSETRIKSLTSYFKYFKHMNLQESFKKLTDDSIASYIWIPQNDSDSPLDLNDTSDADSETHLKQYKRLRSSLKRKRLPSKKWKQQHKQNSLLDEFTVEDNPTLTLRNKRKKIHETSGIPSSTNKLATSKNVKSKLKQTLLNFEVSKTKKQVAENNETDSESEKKRSIITNKQPIFITSTPFSRKLKGPVSFNTSAKWKISDIASNLTPTKGETKLQRQKNESGNLSKESLKKNSSLNKVKAKVVSDKGETTPIKSRIPISLKAPVRTKKFSKIPILRKDIVKCKVKNKNT